MCGIVGYTGYKNCVPILLDGLSRLEYRGYDSAGIATVSNGSIKIQKTKGKINRLKAFVDKATFATCGIGHTRWATHGVPNDINAHPHLSCDKKIVLVHNGVIDNFLELSKDLDGHNFVTQTDTETIVHLIESYYNGDPLKAVTKAVSKIKGSFALAIAFLDKPDTLIAVRYNSPLVLGFSNDGVIIASDIPAILPYTRTVHILEEQKIALLEPNKTRIFDFKLNEVAFKKSRVTLSMESAQKEGFDHFMQKEIYEQPRAIGQVLQGRMNSAQGIFQVENINLNEFKQINKIIITACGTAYHAGLYAKYLIEELSGIPVDVWLASELRYANYPFEKNSMLIAVSQSGETADTLQAVRLANEKNIKTLAITNVHSSSVARESDLVAYMRAGIEIGVAATKSYTAQLVSLAMIALNIARAKGRISSEEARKFIHEIAELPAKIRAILKDTKEIVKCAIKYKKGYDFMYIGRKYNVSTAYEGALKLKEISYLHAEGYAGGEMKHGPLALVDKRLVTVAVSVQGNVYDKMISNIEVIKARGGTIILVTNESAPLKKGLIDHTLYIPKVREQLSPILTIVPLQLFAYHIAKALGRDVDQPRNLAKSVTIE